MTHDPLCWHATTYGPPCDCCALIARVREDEQRMFDFMLTQTAFKRADYAKGRADAARDVAALPFEVGDTDGDVWEAVDRDAAVAAARGGADE